MRAAVLHEIGKPMTIQEVDLDPPKATEVLVRIAAAGVCRSDLHFMKGEASIPIPAVMGHEGSGIVESIGADVTTVKPGDRVILTFVPHCGHCNACLTGHAHLCDKHLATGPRLFDGTSRLHLNGQDLSHMGKVACFAEYSVVPETGCIPITDDIPLEVGALIGCSVTTGVGAAIYSGDVQPGSTVAVIGCGGVGLNVIQGARLMNARIIIAVDVNEAALEFATRFGATHSVNATYEDVVGKIRELTGGLGADYTFEVFGSSETLKIGFDATRKSGTVVMVGIAPLEDMVSINMVDLVRKEKTLKGCYYGSFPPSEGIRRVVELYQAKKLDIDGLIVRNYRLDEINDAYDALDKGVVGRGVITFGS
jgi:S-(hydroxymethyl)glutathione dehydrogenase/alcohol dehydrogenase